MRRVQVPLLLLGAVALAGLPLLRHARNRLISGQPIGFFDAVMGAPGPAVLLAAGLLLLVAPVIWPRASWAGLAGAGLAVAGGAWVSGTVAAALASGSARTSFGAGAWALLAVVLLLGSDTVRRLGPAGWRALAAVCLGVGPVVLVVASGGVSALALAREFQAQRAGFEAAFVRHVVLVVGALGPAVAIGVPLGLLAARRAGVRRAALPVLNVLQTVPSIALFGLLIGPLSALGAAVPGLGVAGVGPAPAILALVVYSLLPIVRNVMEGLRGVPAEARDAAVGMGMSAGQVFWRVEAVLALPVVLSGLRVTTVQAIGLAAVSALIGAGGLGAIMFQGLFANALDLVILGALPVIGLAVAADLGFRAATGWARAAVA